MSDPRLPYEDLLWEANYWHWQALSKNWKPWWTGWRLWPLVWFGSDEVGRITLVVGPVVFPLWRCRCHHCGPEFWALERSLDDTPTHHAPCLDPVCDGGCGDLRPCRVCGYPPAHGCGYACEWIETQAAGS